MVSGVSSSQKVRLTCPSFGFSGLLAPLRQGMLAPPHPMYPGMTDTNYYNGDVKEAHPSQGEK